MSDEYNGWVNRETWAAALWLGNDEGMYREAQLLVQQGFKEAESDAERLGFECSDRMRLNHAGDNLKAWVSDLLDPEESYMVNEETRRNMASDIGSLWRVEWSDVAEAFAPESSEVAS